MAPLVMIMEAQVPSCDVQDATEAIKLFETAPIFNAENLLILASFCTLGVLSGLSKLPRFLMRNFELKIFDRNTLVRSSAIQLRNKGFSSLPGRQKTFTRRQLTRIGFRMRRVFFRADS